MRKNTNDHKILIVEDESGLADIYHQWLADNYEVTTVDNGQAAIDRLSDQYDVVLLDRRMPDVSGDKVLDFIRSQSIDCRVAMVTGIHPDVDIVDMGFDDYVIKPVSENELRDLVQKLICRATYSKEIQEAYQLAAKKSALEAEKSAGELQNSKEYDELQSRFQDLSKSIDATIEELDHDDLSRIFREIATHQNNRERRPT